MAPYGDRDTVTVVLLDHGNQPVGHCRGLRPIGIKGRCVGRLGMAGVWPGLTEMSNPPPLVESTNWHTHSAFPLTPRENNVCNASFANL